MATRCIIGVGGALSKEYPFRRAHIGRAFVEHVAAAHDFTPWRPVSSALADIAEIRGGGIVLCRLWSSEESSSSSSAGAGVSMPSATPAGLAALQCLRYIGAQSVQGIFLAHGELRRPCGQFGVGDGLLWKTAPWARHVAEALIGFDDKKGGRVQRLQIGVGSPSVTALLADSPFSSSVVRWGEEPMSPREAATITETVFPAAYEWLMKQWFGPQVVTPGVIYRRWLPQDVRKGEPGKPNELKAKARGSAKASSLPKRRSPNAIAHLNSTPPLWVIR